MGQLKHEVFWETFNIALYLSIKLPHFNPI
jgi:hypothetical protein